MPSYAPQKLSSTVTFAFSVVCKSGYIPCLECPFQALSNKLQASKHLFGFISPFKPK